MELKIWIYIIIGVIYLIGKVMKKSKDSPADTPVVEPRPTTRRIDIPKSEPSAPKPLTFEELLREITEAKTIKPTVKPPTQPAYVDYDDDIEEEEAKSLETIPANYKKKDSIYKTYEDAEKLAFKRPSLEETMKLQDTDTTYTRFKIFEQEDERNLLLEEYTRDFQDNDGFKKAFVMSEILKTKF